ncbi:SRPBCC family protein [Nocardia sp. NPDC051832]|uniref:SRPBCC family protein n=1 Tax=Nocardia sp. NPDC051832 TaxID=3155673 RepID=UPI0034305C13
MADKVSATLRRFLRPPEEVVRTRSEQAMTDTMSIVVDAPAQQLWDLVTDITGMGRWSTENRRGRWLNGAVEPRVGAWFIGVNRIGPLTWATPCEVTVVAPLAHFEFQVHIVGPRWGYRLEPHPGGTLVTEYREWSYTSAFNRALRWSGPLGRTRDNHALHGIPQTLRALKAHAETLRAGQSDKLPARPTE